MDGITNSMDMSLSKLLGDGEGQKPGELHTMGSRGVIDTTEDLNKEMKELIGCSYLLSKLLYQESLSELCNLLKTVFWMRSL